MSNAQIFGEVVAEGVGFVLFLVLLFTICYLLGEAFEQHKILKRDKQNEKSHTKEKTSA